MDFTPPTSGQSAVAKTTNLSSTVDYQNDKQVPYIGTGKDFDAVVRTLKGAIDRGEIDKENLHRLAHSFGIKPAELADMVGVDKDTIEAKDQDDGPENSVSPPQVSKTFKEFRSETRAVPTSIPSNTDISRSSVTESVMLAGVKVPKNCTRKHMVEVAKRIASLRPEERAKHQDEAARYFQNSNPQFSAQRFHAACNPKMNESGHPALDPSNGDKMTSNPKEAEKLKGKKLKPNTIKEQMMTAQEVNRMRSNLRKSGATSQEITTKINDLRRIARTTSGSGSSLASAAKDAAGGFSSQINDPQIQRRMRQLARQKLTGR
jgi:hypothetical protein